MGDDIYKCQRIPRLGADSSNGNHALNAGPQTGVCPGSAGALPVTKIGTDRNCGEKYAPSLAPKRPARSSVPSTPITGPRTPSTNNNSTVSLSSLQVGTAKLPDQRVKSQSELQDDALNDIF